MYFSWKEYSIIEICLLSCRWIGIHAFFSMFFHFVCEHFFVQKFICEKPMFVFVNGKKKMLGDEQKKATTITTANAWFLNSCKLTSCDDCCNVLKSIHFFHDSDKISFLSMILSHPFFHSFSLNSWFIIIKVNKWMVDSFVCFAII